VACFRSGPERRGQDVTVDWKVEEGQALEVEQKMGEGGASLE